MTLKNALGYIALEATQVDVKTAVETVASAVDTRDTPAAADQLGIAALAIRHDSDTAVTADNDLSLLHVDEEGRLKSSTKPASIALVTGDIVAVAGTVFAPVSRASNVMMHCYGTFSTVNCTFEGSLNSTNGTDGNWFAIQAVRSNANTIELVTGNLSAAPAYAWELSVNGLSFVRVRCTARTSGTQSWAIQRGTYATEPIPAAQATATQPVSGSVTATATPGTGTAYSLVTTASTNTGFIKASAANLYEITVSNPTATPIYVKLYNKTSAPVLASDVPVVTIPVAASTIVPLNFGPIGKRFATGLAIAATAAAAATDTGVAVAGVQIHATYL